MALLAIESVNSIENATLRIGYGKFLKVANVLNNTDKDNYPVLSVAKTIIGLAASADSRFKDVDEDKRYVALLSWVELFVLPAIDSFDADDEEVNMQTEQNPP